MNEARRCKLCGYVGLDVSPALYRTSKGKFVSIVKCDDRKACEGRRAS